MLDLIIRHVPGYGYLPLIEIDGKEVYRGEMWPTAGEALYVLEQRADQHSYLDVA